jgi:hypothetical protein
MISIKELKETKTPEPDFAPADVLRMIGNSSRWTILHLFLSNPGQEYSIFDIQEYFWGRQHEIEISALWMHIHRLKSINLIASRPLRQQGRRVVYRLKNREALTTILANLQPLMETQP